MSVRLSTCPSVRLPVRPSVRPSDSLPVLPQVLQGALTEHQGEVDYLTAAVEQVFQKAPADISQR